jgi:hypothetical protein
VAEANKGSSPPHPMIKLSTSCDIKWTVLMTKMAFSPLFTQSKIDLFELQRKVGSHEQGQFSSFMT